MVTNKRVLIYSYDVPTDHFQFIFLFDTIAAFLYSITNKLFLKVFIGVNSRYARVFV